MLSNGIIVSDQSVMQKAYLVNTFCIFCTIKVTRIIKDTPFYGTFSYKLVNKLKLISAQLNRRVYRWILVYAHIKIQQESGAIFTKNEHKPFTNNESWAILWILNEHCSALMSNFYHIDFKFTRVFFHGLVYRWNLLRTFSYWIHGW